MYKECIKNMKTGRVLLGKQVSATMPTRNRDVSQNRGPEPARAPVLPRVLRTQAVLSRPLPQGSSSQIYTGPPPHPTPPHLLSQIPEAKSAVPGPRERELPIR